MSSFSRFVLQLQLIWNGFIHFMISDHVTGHICLVTWQNVDFFQTKPIFSGMKYRPVDPFCSLISYALLLCYCILLLYYCILYHHIFVMLDTDTEHCINVSSFNFSSSFTESLMTIISHSLSLPGPHPTSCQITCYLLHYIQQVSTLHDSDDDTRSTCMNISFTFSSNFEYLSVSDRNKSEAGSFFSASFSAFTQMVQRQSYEAHSLPWTLFTIEL